MSCQTSTNLLLLPVIRCRVRIRLQRSMWYYAGTGYHDKSDGTFQRNRYCGAFNRLQSPSHFLQEFPRHQGHTLPVSSPPHLLPPIFKSETFFTQEGHNFLAFWGFDVKIAFTHLRDPALRLWLGDSDVHLWRRQAASLICRTVRLPLPQPHLLPVPTPSAQPPLFCHLCSAHSATLVHSTDVNKNCFSPGEKKSHN